MRFAILSAALALMLGCLFTTPVVAQEPKTLSDLPKIIQKTVKDNYSGAKIRGVSKEKDQEGDTVYEIEMTVKGKAIDIIVNAQGEIDTIEEELEISDLPKPVQAAATKTYPKGKITKAEKVTDEDKKVTYEVFIKIGDKAPFEILMAKDGKILKDGSKPATKTEKKEEKDDDEKKPKN